ncbi:hypothetical protein [Undibacterium sp.]|nr:hypothetical protein [Undibacterium sp.]
MKSNFAKISLALSLLAASAFAMASTNDCCAGLECCLKMLACCF